jgi:hypothetical protein
MMEVSKLGGRLFRINSGGGLRDGRPVYCAPPGFPDLVGWIPVEQVAVFLAVEVKTGRTSVKPWQSKFAEAVLKDGGIHVFWKNSQDIVKIVEHIEKIKR